MCSLRGLFELEAARFLVMQEQKVVAAVSAAWQEPLVGSLAGGRQIHIVAPFVWSRVRLSLTRGRVTRLALTNF